MYPFRNSELPVEERVKDLLSRLTVEEKLYMLSSHMYPVERLGVGEWHVGCEVARGYVSKDPEKISTVFPQPIGMASTFDKELMHEIGETASDDARYYHSKNPNGGLMLWGPTVDMERDIRWGRTEEAYGEDPFLSGEMSKAYTLGLAGDDEKYLKTVPTLKHFCANNNEQDRVSCSADITMRTLHEYYYRPFRIAITEGGARSVMTSYNELGGVPAVLQPDLQKLVKDKWGLDFIVTDGGDFSQTVLSHHYVDTHAQALALTLKNGTDVMTDGAEMVAAAARDGLSNGLISMADIDRALTCSVSARFRLGEFDDVHPYKKTYPVPDGEKARALNRRAALEQVCMLKNNGILPLKSVKKIALVGELGDAVYRDWYTGVASYKITIKDALEKEYGAENVSFDNGCDIVALKCLANNMYLSVDSDGVVHADSPDCASPSAQFEIHDYDFGSINFRSVSNGLFLKEDGVYKAASETPYDWFIREWFKPTSYDGVYTFRSWQDRKYDIFADEKNGDVLTIRPCARPDDSSKFVMEVISDGSERCAKLCKGADAVIACVGNHPMQVARECYDRTDITLPKAQSRIVKAAFEANPNTVLTVVSSYPYAINYEQEKLPAILYTSHAGAELGTAVAETLAGRNNPAARCPLTWYSSVHELPDIMEYDIISAESTYLYYGGKPLYPFGHGLSYSHFEYGELALSCEKGGVNASVSVKNASQLDGDETVQLYFRALAPSAKRPLKQLCGFERVRIKSGETVQVRIFIPDSALEFYDVSREKLCVEAGRYEFMAGASSADIRSTAQLDINGEIIPPRSFSTAVKTKNYDEAAFAPLDFSIRLNDHFVTCGDWGGTLVFRNVDFGEAENAEIIAAAPCNPAKITISVNGEEIGGTEIKPSSCKDDFSVYTFPVKKPADKSDMVISLSGRLSFYSIRLY